jgi:hypothetical protein
MHDQTAVKTEGIADLLTQHPGVKVRVDEGYRGLASAFAEQVTAPPRKPAKDAAAELVAAYRQARTEQSSRRICVEHAIAEHKHWRSLQLQRWLGRRESFGETYLAVAGLVSDRLLDADRAAAGRSAQRAPLPIAHQAVSTAERAFLVVFPPDVGRGLIGRPLVAAFGAFGEIAGTRCEAVEQFPLLCGCQTGAHLLLDIAYCRAGRMEVLAAGLGERGG